MRGLRKGLAAAVFVALAGPAAAGPSEEQIDKVVAAIEAEGCVVASPADAMRVEEATGFDDDLLGEIVDSLAEEGLVIVDQDIGGMRLMTSYCEELAEQAPAGPTEEQVDAFIAAVEATGCEVATDEQHTQVEEATGFDDDLLTEIMDTLMDEDVVRFDPELGGLRLMTPACD